MIKHKNILLKLQKKYHEGGYALVSQKSGQIYAFGDDIKKLYDLIEKKKIKDENRLVMYIPPLHIKYALRISLSINNKTPLLLGKENIFDSFNVSFDNDKEQTIFEERKR